MTDQNAPAEIVLASASPRRRELMSRVTPEFRVVPADVDETSIPETDPVRFAVAAAALKAGTVARSFPEAVVIGADTVVAVGLRILGKPDSRQSARRMLELLSGRRHRVITGVAMVHQAEDRLLTGYELTYVTFRPLSEGMIEAYLDQDEFLDKAGGYAVQDVGDAFVARIERDFDNVVGFPVKKVKAMLARFMVPPLTVEVEDVDMATGDGVARTGGRKIMIPGAVEGDVARIQLLGERRGACRADVLRIEKPSPARVPPACRHFGACGGCLLQSTGYERQLDLKRRSLERILAEAGVSRPGEGLVRAVEPSPSVYGYRNKMEFGFGGQGGELVLGLRERVEASRQTWRRTTALSECPILGPIVGRLFPPVLEFARGLGLAAHDTRTGKGLLRHLVVREGKRTGDLMVLLVTAPAPDFDPGPLAEVLAGEIPGLRSLWHVTSGRLSDSVGFDETRLVRGSPWIEERLDGLKFRVHPQTFFQTNTEAAELLYRAIVSSVPVSPGTGVLGLYSGAGTIEVTLARAAANVRGIEVVPENVRAASEAAALNAAANCEFTASTVEGFLKFRPAGRTDLLVLDPPRPGLSPKALKQVLALGVPSVAYVSCNPAALARDLGHFAASGYSIEIVKPFDFFPHTPHLEALAILRK